MTKLQHAASKASPSLLWTQVGVASGMLIVVLLLVFFSFYIIRRLKLSNGTSMRRLSLIISRLNCFTAGVFISIGFLDIFMDVLENFQEAAESMPFVEEFPFAAFFTLMGFFVILTVEQLILAWRQNSLQSSHDTTQSFHQLLKEEQVNAKGKVPQQNSPIMTSGFTGSHEVSAQSYGSVDQTQEVIHSHFHDLPHQSTLQTTVLVLAICIHSVFEGLAMGLSRNVQSFVNILLALIMHKGVVAVGVGFNLAVSNLSRNLCILVCVLFSAASPIGTVIGVVIQASSGEDHLSPAGLLVNASLQSMAVGTFFYIVFFEILPHEFKSGVDRLPKLLCLFLGYGFVSIYLIVLPHHHHHEH